MSAKMYYDNNKNRLNKSNCKTGSVDFESIKHYSKNFKTNVLNQQHPHSAN